MWANKLFYIQWILEPGKISPMTVRNNGFPFCPSAASNIPFEMTFPIFRGSRISARLSILVQSILQVYNKVQHQQLFPVLLNLNLL